MNAPEKEQETIQALDQGKKILAGLQILLARSYVDRSEREFCEGNFQESLNWLLGAYQVVPEESFFGPFYLKRCKGQAIFPILVRKSGKQIL